jgi:hypothetical protein
MSTNKDIPSPPTDATEREQQLWKELINRIVTLKRARAAEAAALPDAQLPRQYSEGD